MCLQIKLAEKEYLMLPVGIFTVFWDTDILKVRSQMILHRQLKRKKRDVFALDGQSIVESILDGIAIYNKSCFRR
jgi:hypothetical protein